MKKISWFAAAVFMVLCFTGNAYAQISATERAALIALYNSTDGANWTNNTGWLGAEGTECSWYGVMCDAGGNTVNNLYLANNGLTGSIPPEIGDLLNLTRLELAVNQLSGSIPTEIGSLSNLTYLSLTRNQVTGIIPASLFALSHLEILALGSNQLSGTIPSGLGNLPSLRELYLWENQLTGGIPSALGNLTNLTALQLSNNRLTGTIPNVLGNLTKLTTLTLDRNQLIGIIPPEMGNLISLQELQLWSNQLTGSIPIQIGNLVNLTALGLAINQLSGSIPTQIGTLVKIQYLFLDQNQLTGSIPSEIRNLVNLIGLTLSSNQLSGSIPPEIGNFTNLNYLLLGNNQLTGAVPTELTKLVNLTNITLCNNTDLFINDPALSAFLAAKMDISCMTVICDATAAFTVDKPLADNQISIIVNDTVNFTDTSTGTGTYLWNFGDGTTDTTAGNKSHQYLTQGTFTASLTLTSSSGCTSAKQITVKVLPCNVTAAFTPNARVVNMGDTITFTNTSTGTLTGATFDWDFDGDGTPEAAGVGTTAQTHSYSAPGEQTVILTAHAANGCITAYQMNIYVNDPACAGILEAAVTVSPASVELGQTVSFTGTATGTGTPTSWSWDVNGDGTEDYAVQNPSHTYSVAGTYSAILTVINGTCTAFAEKTVTVNCNVTAGFSLSSASVTVGTSVTFTNTSTGTGAAGASYEWDFDGNGTSDLTTTGLTNPPARAFNTVGTFTVILKAAGAGGCTSTVQKTVTVTQPYIPYEPVEENTTPELTASVSGKEVILSWTEISGAGGYKLLYAPYPDGTPVSEGDLGLVNSLRGPLPPGSAYYVAVKPYNGIEGWGEISNVTYFEIPLTFPAAPKLSVQTAGDTVSVSWTGVQNAAGYIFYYAPYPGMESIGHADMGMQTSLSGPLPPGSAFYVAVQAYDKNGVGDLSNIEYFVIPAIPESPALTVGMNGNSVNLSWTTVNGADGYKLIYSPFPTGDPEGIADVGNQTSIPSFTLPAGSTYYVAVQGYNSGGESQMSNREVITIPALLSAPSLFVEKMGRTISLSWTSVINADGYILYYLNAAGKKIGELDMKKQRELSLTLPAKSKFYVAVQAYNAEGKSGFSNVELFELSY